MEDELHRTHTGNSYRSLPGTATTWAADNNSPALVERFSCWFQKNPVSAHIHAGHSEVYVWMGHKFLSSKVSSKSEIRHCLDRLRLYIQGDLDIVEAGTARARVDVTVDRVWLPPSAGWSGAKGNTKDRHKQHCFDKHLHGGLLAGESPK